MPPPLDSLASNDPPPPQTPATNVADALRARAALAREEAAALSRRANRIAFGRLAAVAAIAVAGAAALERPQPSVILRVAIVAAIAGFVALVGWSRRVATLRQRALGRVTVSEQGAYRADRDWSNVLAQPWTWQPDGGESLRIDLDVVGRASLIQLLPAISAGVGAPRMRDWLSTIPSRDELRERQAAVRELINAVELRDAFELYAHHVRVSEARVDNFVAWGRAAAQREPLWLGVMSRVLPLITIIAICASVLLPAVTPMAVSITIVSIFATAVLATLVRSRTGDAVRAAEIGAHMAEAYAELGALVLRTPFNAPRLRALQDTLGGDTARRVDRALTRLHRLSRWADVRSSPMMHGALQALFAWDCQIARAVEQWRATHGAALGPWFAAFADAECLGALGGLAYTNPSWTFPDLTADAPLRVRARGLAHPLLPTATRIANDVDIGPPGTVLLISGSNMSGKSTLLRAIGLNLLLARIGSAVCAEELSGAPMRLMTSLRVQDSLADGMSYFMAEALRLRDIIVAAEERVDIAAPPVLYLVDEILRGTNSEERAVAARFIVARLLQTPAIGIITTHDLGIFDDAELADRVRHAHFAEKFSDLPAGERLVFDHRLRQGPTTSTNALRLLALIGLTPADRG